MAFSRDFFEFLNQIKDFEESHEGHAVFYRGQSSDKPLNSGVFRLDHLKTIEDIKEEEETAYRMFLNFGHPFLKNQKDWELLFIMQHHGVRTRLLDWSPALMTALFFAISGAVSSPVLWMLNPAKLNKVSTGHAALSSPPLPATYEKLIKDESRLEGSFAMIPTRNTTRQIIQQGMFTVQDDSMLPLEEEHGGDLLKEGILKKIDIPLNIVLDIRAFLNMNSIDHFTMYPDLDGLSRRINTNMSTLYSE